ncbi:MAG: hypothetical protein ACRCT8_02135 [Lacipirellulaceae bacterium]
MRSLSLVGAPLALALAWTAAAQDRYATPPAPSSARDFFKSVPAGDARYAAPAASANGPGPASGAVNPLRSLTPPDPAPPATTRPFAPQQPLGGGSTFSTTPAATRPRPQAPQAATGPSGAQRSGSPPPNPFAALAQPTGPSAPQRGVAPSQTVATPQQPARTRPAFEARDAFSAAPAGASSATQPRRPFEPLPGADPYARNQPPALPSRPVPPAVGFADLAQRGSTATVSAEREATTRAMLQAMLRAPQGSRLPGNPTSLASVLAGASSRDAQTMRTDAYWALTSAVADYYLGLNEVQELERLRQRVPTYSTTLTEAQSQLARRVEASARAARAAQLRLGRSTGGDTGVLPTDVPFCGPYATRFAEIFAGGAPEEAQLLNDLLPMRLAELMDAADAVERNESWVKKVTDANGSTPEGTAILRALELNALSRRAFVQIARDYNLQISRYAQLATPGNIDSGRLVAMLIRTQGAGSFTAGQPGGLEFRPGTVGARR